MADSARRGSTEGYNFPRTARVAHLGGVEVGYRMAGPYRQYKPTLLMINSFTTNSDLYASQFANTQITDAMNLIAVEPIGHGLTKLRTPGVETFTYWDTAHVILQLMDVIGVKKAFALGTSQGGWIVARLALLAPDRIAGIIPLGTSMDAETERTRRLGCGNLVGPLNALIEAATSSSPTDDYKPTKDYLDWIVDVGFGKDTSGEIRQQWHDTVTKNYTGDAGRRRFRECAINLRDRDSLHGRLVNIRCPVLWLHGDQDVVYSVPNAQEEIRMFTGSPDAKLVVVEGGHHFLSWTNPKEVDAAVLEFVTKNSQGQFADARALRERVGMVDI